MIEDNSQAAVGKSTDITVSGLIHTYRITNVSVQAAGMVKPFDRTISVILGDKDIGGIRTGACDRKTIKRRRTCEVTGNIEAIRASNCDSICAISLISDSTSASARPKIVTARIVLGNKGVTQP